MTPKEVYDYFENGYRFAKKTGMAQSNMVYWFKKGYVPINSQAKLHRLTGGKLKIDLDLTIEEEKPNEGNETQ